jgi:tetratricopeptide (TPR) repeat protein
MVADHAPPAYRARAIQGLGAVHHDLGRLDEALKIQLEALRAVPDKKAHGLQTTLMAHFEIAIVKSLDGDHKGALSKLESLKPLVHLVTQRRPYYFYLYCSELAIELGELGHIAEAEAAIAVALHSPYATAYPNWAETRQEIEAKRTAATPSVVAVNQAAQSDPSLQEEAAPLKPVKAIAFCWLIGETVYSQTALATLGLLRPSLHQQPTCTTLEQLGSSIQSRAPPLHS